MKSFDPSLLPRKVSLSGSDCFHLVLDKHARVHRAGGNTMRLVLYFPEPLQTERIKKMFADSPLMHWLANIRLQKRFGGIPRWRYRDGGGEIPVREHRHETAGEIPAFLLEREMPLRGGAPVEADIVAYPGGRTAFVLSWNHILTDVKGIAMLLQHVQQVYEGKTGFAGDTFFPEPEKKAGLFGQIRNMYAVKKFIEDSSRAPIASVAGKKDPGTAAFKNRILAFTAEETATMHARAVQQGAKLGDNPFHLSCCAAVVHRLLQKRNRAGLFWVPIPYDGRAKGSTGPIVSNSIAFVFYRLPENTLGSTRETVSALSAQLMAQIKDRMPRKYGALLGLMRHIPLRLYYFLVNRSAEGSFASFLYSSAGDTFNGLTNLFGGSVEKLTIFPSATFPPGLTFSFQQHRDALNVNIAYSPAIVGEEELDGIANGLKNFLLTA